MPNSLIVNHFYGPDPDSFSIWTDSVMLSQDYANPYVTKSAEPIIRDDTGFYFIYNGIGKGLDVVYKYDSNLTATPLWMCALGGTLVAGARVYSGRACISGNYIYVFIRWLNGVVVVGSKIYMIDKTTGSLVYERDTRDGSGCSELWVQNGVLYNAYNTGVCRIRGYSLVDLTDVGPVILVAVTDDVEQFAVVGPDEVWGCNPWTNDIWKYNASFVMQSTYTIPDINVNAPDYDYIAGIRYVDNYIFVMGYKTAIDEGKVYKVDPTSGSIVASSLVGYSFSLEVFSPSEPVAAITNSIGQVIW